jgi:hypothetical protein
MATEETRFDDFDYAKKPRVRTVANGRLVYSWRVVDDDGETTAESEGQRQLDLSEANVKKWQETLAPWDDASVDAKRSAGGGSRSVDPASADRLRDFRDFMENVKNDPVARQVKKDGKLGGYNYPGKTSPLWVEFDEWQKEKKGQKLHSGSEGSTGKA